MLSRERIVRPAPWQGLTRIRERDEAVALAYGERSGEEGEVGLQQFDPSRCALSSQ